MPPATMTNKSLYGSVPDRQGYMRFAGNRELADREQALAKLDHEKSTPEVDAVVGYVNEVYIRNREYKRTQKIESEMLTALRQRNAEYDAEKLAAIQQQGGTDVFISLTGVKCRAAEAWLADILATAGDTPWQLQPTPEPSLPPRATEVIKQETMARWKQQVVATGEPVAPSQVFRMAESLRKELEENIAADARRRARRMQRRIRDQMAEGGWTKVFDEFLTDLVTLKVAILKGPIVRRRKELKWVRDAKGDFKPKAITTPKLTFDRVSPFDFYPSEHSTGVDDGDNIERQRLSRKSLQDLKDVEGYDAGAIDLVLTHYPQGLTTQTDIDQERADLELKETNTAQAPNLIEALEFWGSLQGKMLIDKGIMLTPDGKAIEPLTEYEVNAVVVGRYVIYLGFNQDPLGRRPYSKTMYEVIPGSFWGKGVPELMRDIQVICNASVRAMVNNVGIASGPQVAINDIKRLPPGTDIENLYAWKIWLFENTSQSGVKPIDFFQPDSNAAELMGIYKQFESMADDYTGIPAYTYGSPEVSGAGRTASGLSMLMNSAARGIKKVIARVASDVIQDIVQRMFEWNMLYSDDQSIKGDVQIVPVGILAMIMKEQMIGRRMQFLETVTNPVDMQLIGLGGRADVLRENAKLLELPESTVKTKEEVEALEERLERAAQVPVGGTQGALPGPEITPVSAAEGRQRLLAPAAVA